MNNKEIRKILINKRYNVYYAIIFFVLLIGALLSLLFFVLFALFVGNVLINFHRCRRFHQFIIKNNLPKDTIQSCKITIEKESYKLKPVYSSYDAKIQPRSRATNAICIETDDYFLVFFAVDFFRIFQEVLKPCVFIKPGKERCITDKNIEIIDDYKAIETEQDTVIDFPNKHGIKKLIIPRAVAARLASLPSDDFANAKHEKTKSKEKRIDAKHLSVRLLVLIFVPVIIFCIFFFLPPLFGSVPSGSQYGMGQVFLSMAIFFKLFCLLIVETFFLYNKNRKSKVNANLIIIAPLAAFLILRWLNNLIVYGW